MLSAFTATLHVSNLSKPEHVLQVLDEQPDLFSKDDIATLARRMSGYRYVIANSHISIDLFFVKPEK